jgi:hypothetical protein
MQALPGQLSRPQACGVFFFVFPFFAAASICFAGIPDPKRYRLLALL